MLRCLPLAIRKPLIEIQWGITTQLQEWLKIKRLMIKSVGDVVEWQEFLHFLGKNVQLYNSFG